MTRITLDDILPALRRHGYLLAAVATLAALALRLLWLNGILETHVPFLFFYISVVLAAGCGGLGAGLFATALGALAGVYFFMAPTAAFRSLDHLETVIFVLTGVLISFLYQSLSAARSTIEARQQVLEREIAERRSAETALAEAARRKDEFLATLAHELRNPLAPICNALELLGVKSGAQVRGARDPNLLNDSLRIIARQVRQLAQLVNDLMDVARITQGKIILHRQPVLLSDVVNGAVESVRPLTEAKRQTLRVELPPEDAWLDGDATRLIQIFTNLLSNASKYTETGGVIALEAYTAAFGAGPKTARISVRDTGVGIPEDMLPRVFNIFEQEPAAARRAQGGLGIGLSLVRKFSEMHGGSVTADSEGPGKGAVFTVTLPTIPAPAAAPPPPAAVESGAQRPMMRALVVDDNRDSAQTLGWLLESLGCEVKTAPDGESALQIAPAFRPDYVLLDIGLPKMDGYGVCEALRRIPGLEETVIVAQTGYGQDRDRRRSAAAGFDRHLVKPVAAEQLRAIVSNGP